MKKGFFIVVVTTLLFTSIDALVVTPEKNIWQTQGEMNDEACGKHKKADAELNRVYHRILREYANNRAFTRKFKSAQRAWIVFRDAHLASIYPDPSPSTYGSVNSMCRCITLTQLTDERVNQLKRWIDGTTEGDVCAGSIRLKK